MEVPITRRIPLLVLCGLVLAACGQRAMATPALKVTPEPSEDLVATVNAQATSLAALKQPTATLVPPTATSMPTLTATAPAAPTVTPAPTSIPPPTATSGPLISSSSGLAQDLESFADKPLGQFVTASQVDLDRVAYVSRFRSKAGHDYTDSFETCSSMKHYFTTPNHPDLTTPIYSAVDGVLVWRTKGSGDEEGVWLEQAGTNADEIGFLDERLFIRPDAAPNVWVKHHHVSPIAEIVKTVPVALGREVAMGQVDAPQPGFRVSAGQLIAHGLGEISVEQHLSGSGRPSSCNTGVTRQLYGKFGSFGPCGDVRRFHSIFSLMTDEVFALYQARGATSRDDFIISAEERAARPLQCEGYWFVDMAGRNDADEIFQLTP